MMMNIVSRERLQASAWWSLASRYGHCLRQAWAIRRQLADDDFRRDEAEFLAGALALQKSPPAPLPRVAIALLTGFALLALLWAIIGKVDVVATATGKIVPSGHSKPVQAIETASVKAIFVRDGDAVRQGDLLLQLDSTMPAADVDRIDSELIGARLQALRARAMLAAQVTGQLAALTATDLPPPRLAEARRQVAGLFAEYRARLTQLDADIDRRASELRTAQAQIHKLEHTLPLASQRAEDLKELSNGGFVSRHAWMEKEQMRLEQAGELATLHSRVSEISASLREAQGQRQTLIAETRRQMLDSAADGEQKAATLRQERVKAQARKRLMEITAPIDGTVQQLAVHTIGGVVTPAQVLMVLVPHRHPVEVDAVLENKDVGFIKAGQVVEVKIETFPYTRYGTVAARIVHVSPDAITDDQRGLAYLAKIRLEQTSINVDGHAMSLLPGMAVVAEIKTGRRRVIDFLLSPLIEHTSESLRER